MQPFDSFSRWMPFMSTPGFNGNAPSPGYTPPAFGGFPGAASGTPPGVVSSTPPRTQYPGVLAYEDPRMRGIQAMGAELLRQSAASPTKVSTGAALGNAQIAGMNARDRQIQMIDEARQAQRRDEFMNAQVEVMRQNAERQARIQAAAATAKFDPKAPPQQQSEQLRNAAGALWAAGDYEGAMQAMGQADKLYNPDAQKDRELDRRLTEAQIEASRASAAASRRGPQPNYRYGMDKDGREYMVREGDTRIQYLVGEDGKPIKGKLTSKQGGELVPMTAQDAQQAQAKLRELGSLYQWAGKSGDEHFGPGITNIWDRTYGKVTGSPDYAMQRKMDFITSGAILQAASQMKGALSDKDVNFLRESQPKPGDPIEVRQQWLASLYDTISFNLKQQGYDAPALGGNSLYDKYNLEPQK